MLHRFLGSLMLWLSPLTAEVKFPAILSDHMLIQQQAPVRIWGKAAAGERIAVEIHGRRATAIADNSGNWRLFLPAMPAGGPYEMKIHADKDLIVHDVLVGEVWVGSGQSNMGFPMYLTENSDAAIAASNFPRIRLFAVAKKISETPLDDVVGEWRVCSPASVKAFSAVGYFFARALHLARRVPVGLIESSVGGTPAIAWTSDRVLKANPSFIQMNPPGPELPNGGTPSVFWNGMIAPLTRYAIRGVAWYQGETEAVDTRAYPYRYLIKPMIEDWREQWAEGDFPFLFVQVANHIDSDSWPVLRESQAEALKVRNTAMIVTIDIGSPRDVHPKNKRDVGNRLALAARGVAYGERIEYSGPLFRQMSSEDAGLRLYFDHIGTGLKSRGGLKLAGFEVAGKDGKYLQADARIDGQTVLVAGDQLSQPVSVRYAWADNPQCTLENSAGLPASPFRAELK